MYILTWYGVPTSSEVRALPDLATALTLVTTALTSIHLKNILKNEEETE
jgi:hypothetical protein